MTSWVPNGRSRSEFGASQCCFWCRHIESSSSGIYSTPTCKVRRAALKRGPDSVDMNNSSTRRCLFSFGTTTVRFGSPVLLTSQVSPLVHATFQSESSGIFRHLFTRPDVYIFSNAWTLEAKASPFLFLPPPSHPHPRLSLSPPFRTLLHPFGTPNAFENVFPAR